MEQDKGLEQITGCILSLQSKHGGFLQLLRDQQLNDKAHHAPQVEDLVKIPFLMHYQGYKYQEIADHLDLPLGTVKSRIFFARKELKDLIGKRYSNLDNLRERSK